MGLQTNALPWAVLTANWKSPSTSTLRTTLDRATTAGFDWIITPLFTDQQILNNELNLDNSLIPCEQDLPSASSVKKIYIEINSCIDLTNTKHRGAFEFILGYAVYLGIYGVVMHLPPTNILPEYLQQLNRIADTDIFGRIHIIWCAKHDAEGVDKTWKDFIYVRDNISKKVFIDLMLEIGVNLPEDNKLLRWLSQRVDYISLQPEIFTTNNKGFPVLSYKHEHLVRRLFSHKTKIVIKDPTIPHESSLEPSSYLKFIQFMIKQLQRPHETGYVAMNHYDYLQDPLQPYADNLESETYQIFEMDNAKYDEYEIALTDALNTFPVNQRVVIYYVGCGRGALLYNCFQASKKTGRKIHIYAVEKNPYPLQAVKRRITINRWTKAVDLILTDVKEWEPKEEADICLSQLLGGFGDNQLSPECLSWAQQHIWKPYGKQFQKKTICIPQNYTSLITPLSYSRVHRGLKQSERETYFTVNIHNSYQPCQVVECWTFSHPLAQDETFERHSQTTFRFPQPCLIHGFAGYFSSELFGKGRLSIVPADHTHEMESWYPLFFSFKKEVMVDQSHQLTINLSRKSAEKRVWYEWSYEVTQDKQPVEKSPVHNLNGCRHSIHC